jgi:hypothetical protein
MKASELRCYVKIMLFLKRRQLRMQQETYTIYQKHLESHYYNSHWRLT